MTEVPSFAPGCFGSALSYQEKNPICKNCPFNSQCFPLHETNLATLRAQFGITPKPKPIKKPAATPASTPAIMALPPKVQYLVNKLDAANLRIVEKLNCGENPVEGKVPFLQVACHLLLRLNKPLSRSLLTMAFVQKLGWSENTAHAHARMTFQALTHIGAIVESEHGATIKRG